MEEDPAAVSKTQRKFPFDNKYEFSQIHFDCLRGRCNFDTTQEMIDEQDIDGRTPLMWSIIGKQKKLAKEIIKRSNRLDCQDRWGQTAIHYAIHREYSDLLDLLVERGADLQIENVLGQSPQQVIEIYKRGRPLRTFSLEKKSIRFSFTRNVKKDRFPNLN